MPFFCRKFFAIATLCCLVGSSCNLKPDSIDRLTSKAKREALLEKFPKVPHDEILHQINSSKLYADLFAAYQDHLINLKNYVEADGAKLIVVVLTTRVGKSGAPESIYGIPQIVNICDNLSLTCVNLVPRLLERDLSEIAQIPEETILSPAGAEYVAGLLAEVIDSACDYKSTKDLSHLPKPATFGDLEPGLDEMRGVGTSLPYRLKVNSQGLRLEQDLTFPKKRQTVLVLGDSKVIGTFLNYQQTPMYLLQQKLPDRLIVSAGGDNYTMDDFESLYKEKARYTEPDIVLVCTDGGDILEEYFSQRNKYSRRKKIYPPTRVEEDFYFNLYRNN
jgi:hypothetical protein